MVGETSRDHRSILVVGADLMARARLEAAAPGADISFAPAESLLAALKRSRPEILIVDLQAGGYPLVEALTQARSESLLPSRVVGFYPHVDAALGEAARAAGCDAVPRGRFWRELPSMVDADVERGG